MKTSRESEVKNKVKEQATDKHIHSTNKKEIRIQIIKLRIHRTENIT